MKSIHHFFKLEEVRANPNWRSHYTNHTDNLPVCGQSINGAVTKIDNIWNMPIDKSFWLTDDDIWMKERKKQWKPIKAAIDYFLVSWSRFPREDVKYLKNYFLNGIIPAAYCSFDLFIMIWLHPSCRAEHWQPIKVMANGLPEVKALRSFYVAGLNRWRDLRNGGADCSSPNGNDGILGDRSYPMFDFLINDSSGEWDNHEEVLILKQRFKNASISSGLYCCLSMHYDSFNHNLIGLHRIEEWHLRLKDEGFAKETKERLMRLFYSILNYSGYAKVPSFDNIELMEQRMIDVNPYMYYAVIFTTEGHDSPLQLDLASRLLTLLEVGDFDDKVKLLWEKCKATYIDWLANVEDYIQQ